MAEESLHDTVAAAYDKAGGEAPAPDGGSSPGSTPAPEAPAAPSSSPDTPAQLPAPSGGPASDYLAKPAPAPAQDRGDGRDAAGRFAPRPSSQTAPEAPTGATSASPPPEAATAAPPPPEPAQPALRAPSSWRPEIREHWAKLPAEVQQEVLRREQDMIRQMTQIKPAMNFAQQMSRAMQPYGADIQAITNGDVVAFNAANAQARHVIFHGAPQQKAEFVADLLANAGVDINLLADAIDRRGTGRAAPANGQGPSGYGDMRAQLRQEFAPLFDVVGELRNEHQRRQEQVNTQVQSELEAFVNAPGHEYFDDLRESMWAFMQAAANVNRDVTWQQAYDAAAAMHPTVGPLVEKKREQARAKAAADAAEAARRSAVSLPSGGAPQGSPAGAGRDGANLHSTVAAAYDAAMARSAGR